MLTTIHSRSFETEDVTPYVTAETKWMERYFVELITARWTFERDGVEIVARCEVHTRSKYFVGAGRAVELRAAAALAAEKVVRWRRLLKRFSRRERRARAGSLRH